MSERYQIQELKQRQTDKSSTYHNSIPQNSMDSSANNNMVLQQLFAQHSSLNQRDKKYGNIKVLYQNDRFLFTIGPNYICFIVAYILFTLLNFVLIYTASNAINNIWLDIANILLSIAQNLSYLTVALSNPGIQTQDTIPTDEDVTQQIKRYCKKCGIRMQKGTHHCRQCDVCVRKYDHHCPWTSKCIGQKNLTKFYWFVTLTMVYIIYCVVLLLVCLAKTSLQLQTNRKYKTL